MSEPSDMFNTVNHAESQYRQVINRLTRLKGEEWIAALGSRKEFDSTEEQSIATILDMLEKLRSGFRSGNQSKDLSIESLCRRLNLLIDEMEKNAK